MENDDDFKRTLKLKHLNILAKSGCFNFTEEKNVPWFDYTSNRIGPYYAQSMTVFSRRDFSKIAIDGMVSYIKHILPGNLSDIISAGESRDWPFALPVAHKIGADIRMLYKDGKSWFGVNNIKGEIILHIADLNNEGSSMKKWNEMISKDGGTIANALFYVDRMEEGVRVLEELNINRHAIVDLDNESWRYLLNDQFISQSMYQELVKYWKDPLKWGCEKILTDPGPLFALIKNEKKRERGIGIFELYNKETNSELASVLGVVDIEHFLTKVSTLSVKEVEELVSKSSIKK